MRRALLGFALVALAVAYVELRLPSPASAQGRDAVYERLAVTGAVKLEAFRGQIAAFNGACPADWDEMTELRGRLIVGLVDGGTLAQSVGDALTNGELRRGGTVHPDPTAFDDSDLSTAPIVRHIVGSGTNKVRLYGAGQIQGDPFIRIVVGVLRSGSVNNNPPAPYVQLRYCEYQP